MSRHADTKLSRQLRRAQQPNFVDIGKREMAATTRKRHGDRAADAGGSASHHSRSPAEIHALSHP
jgi:hypothetical protein